MGVISLDHFMKSIFSSILVLLTTTTISVAQRKPTFEGTLNIEILLDGQPFTDLLHNTTFLYKHFALESIYKIIGKQNISINPDDQTKSVEHQSNTKQFDSFILTDFKNTNYTTFDTLGGNPITEASPVLHPKTGFDFFRVWREFETNIDSYKYVKDSVVNNRRCRMYQSFANENSDETKRNKIVVYIDPKLKRPAFQLSSKLESALKGTIIQFDEFYASGNTTSVKLKYHEGLDRTQIEKMQKFISLINEK